MIHRGGEQGPSREYLGQSVAPELNLLSGLPSLQRMSKRDQRQLALRLRTASVRAKVAGDVVLAANLLRAVYELEEA